LTSVTNTSVAGMSIGGVGGGFSGSSSLSEDEGVGGFYFLGGFFISSTFLGGVFFSEGVEGGVGVLGISFSS